MKQLEINIDIFKFLNFLIKNRVKLIFLFFFFVLITNLVFIYYYNNQNKNYVPKYSLLFYIEPDPINLLEIKKVKAILHKHQIKNNLEKKLKEIDPFIYYENLMSLDKFYLKLETVNFEKKNQLIYIVEQSFNIKAVLQEEYPIFHEKIKENLDKLIKREKIFFKEYNDIYFEEYVINNIEFKFDNSGWKIENPKKINLFFALYSILFSLILSIISLLIIQYKSIK